MSPSRDIGLVWLRRARQHAGMTVSILLLTFGSVLGVHAAQPAARLSGLAPQSALAQIALQQAVSRYGHRPQLEHGMRIVMGQNCSAARPCLACASCHGLRGEGNAAAGIPRLTAQSYRYLYYALRNFASGMRSNSTMQAVARKLSDEEMREVAEWYSAQRLKEPRLAGVRANAPHPRQSTLAEGGAISAIGSARDAVEGCANCHGPAGMGEPPVYPYLAGQYAGYLQSQLEDFKSGKRRGDPLRIMPDLAAQLSENQIHAVAEYFGSIEPPIYLRDRHIQGVLRIGAPLGPAPRSATPPEAAGGRASQSSGGRP